MKQAVIAPSMLYLLYPLNGTVEGYSKDQFVEDLVKEACCSGNTSHALADRHSARKTFEDASRLVPSVYP
jgi:hypothetical protein